MRGVEELVTLLLERADRTGGWHVSAAELADRFTPVDYYRAAYLGGLAGVELFGAANAGELVAVLEQLVGPGAAGELRMAGLFLDQDDRLLLTERFVRTIRTAVALHVPEPETFRAMLRQFRRYETARLAYLETYLPTEELVKRCAAEYAAAEYAAAGHVAPEHSATRPMPRARVESARRAGAEIYLRMLLQRHVVVVDELAPALLEILRTVARHEGLLPGRRPTDREPARPRAPERREWALGVLGIQSIAVSQAEIRSRYRQLMRRYHPDVNPSGLETAKRLNSAYAALLEEA